MIKQTIGQLLENNVILDIGGIDWYLNLAPAKASDWGARRSLASGSPNNPCMNFGMIPQPGQAGAKDFRPLLSRHSLDKRESSSKYFFAIKVPSMALDPGFHAGMTGSLNFGLVSKSERQKYPIHAFVGMKRSLASQYFLRYFLIVLSKIFQITD